MNRYRDNSYREIHRGNASLYTI